MIKVRRSSDRGFFDHGWLKTFHTFSFADYHDPKYMGFRSLRVINEDTVEEGQGFGTHPHRDMEIITYVLKGTLAHKDSMGNGSVIQPGDVQYMSAGTGVTHSEFNHSDSEVVHLLQIWILPDAKNHPPRYGQKNFSEANKLGRLCLVASKEGRDQSIAIHQDADLYVSILNSGQKLEFKPIATRGQWIQVAKGEVLLNGEVLKAGDGAQIESEQRLEVTGKSTQSEFLLFDLGL